jgi:hypothetical protein
MMGFQVARRSARTLWLAMALGMLALSFGIGPAHANGNPLTITLSYLDGVSNWGPMNAAGVVEMVGKEGEVRLVASGLPQLRGDRYELWLMDTTHGDRMALGSFGASDDGVGKLDVILDNAIPDKTWNLVMVSVETEAVQGVPNARRSIAGRFPPAAAANRPGELPRTGGDPIESSAPPVLDAGKVAAGSGAFFALWAVILAAGGFALGRRTSRRSQ